MLDLLAIPRTSLLYYTVHGPDAAYQPSLTYQVSNPWTLELPVLTVFDGIDGTHGTDGTGGTDLGNYLGSKHTFYLTR